MLFKNTLIAAALTLALVGNAQAGVKDWLRDKRDKLRGETSQPQEQVAATLETVEVQGEREQRPPVDKGKALQSAGKGCGVGALIGAVAGVDPQLACVAGGAIGFGWSYRKQVKDARAVEVAARAAGMDATVRTEQRVDEKGKRQEALAALTIRYEAADMDAMDAKTVAMLDKLAGLTGKAKNTLTVRFEGVRACEVPLQALNDRQALDRHTVVNACGSGPSQITVSPLPDVR